MMEMDDIAETRQLGLPTLPGPLIAVIAVSISAVLALVGAAVLSAIISSAVAGTLRNINGQLSQLLQLNRPASLIGTPVLTVGSTGTTLAPVPTMLTTVAPVSHPVLGTDNALFTGNSSNTARPAMMTPMSSPMAHSPVTVNKVQATKTTYMNHNFDEFVY